NGDGLADVAVLSNVSPLGYSARIHLGRRTSGPSSTPDITFLFGPPFGPTVLLPAISAGNLGDVNGDGFSDVGALVNLFPSGPGPGNPDWGLRIHVYQGAAISTQVEATFFPDNNFHWLLEDGGYGLGLSAAGDINGDGF